MQGTQYMIAILFAAALHTKSVNCSSEVIFGVNNITRDDPKHHIEAIGILRFSGIHNAISYNRENVQLTTAKPTRQLVTLLRLLYAPVPSFNKCLWHPNLVPRQYPCETFRTPSGHLLETCFGLMYVLSCGSLACVPDVVSHMVFHICLARHGLDFITQNDAEPDRFFSVV